MTRFHSQETIAAPLDQVVRWHSLPGAVTRLSPHWAQTVVAEGDPNRPGTRTSMKIAVPGTRGSVRVPWKSEHFALDDAGIQPLAAFPLTDGPRQDSPAAPTGSALRLRRPHGRFAAGPAALVGAPARVPRRRGQRRIGWQPHHLR